MFRRNDLTQARDPFSQSTPIDSSGRLLPQSLWSQFGGSIAGPIIKNKTFFFGDYQGTRAKDAGSVLLRVPTAAERTGDLSALLNPPVRISSIRPADSILRSASSLRVTSFRNSELSAPAVKLLGLLPLPNIANAGPSDPNYSASGNGTFNGDVFNIRSDHFQSERLHFFGRYTFTQFLKEAPGAFGAVAGGPQLITATSASSAKAIPGPRALLVDLIIRFRRES